MSDDTFSGYAAVVLITSLDSSILPAVLGGNYFPECFCFLHPITPCSSTGKSGACTHTVICSVLPVCIFQVCGSWRKNEVNNVWSQDQICTRLKNHTQSITIVMESLSVESFSLSFFFCFDECHAKWNISEFSYLPNITCRSTTRSGYI